MKTVLFTDYYAGTNVRVRYVYAKQFQLCNLCAKVWAQHTDALQHLRR